MKEGVRYLLDSLKKMYGKKMVQTSENTYELKGLSTLSISECRISVTDKVTGTEIQVNMDSLEEKGTRERGRNNN